MIKLDWCVINFGGLQEKISAFAVLGNGGYTVTYMDLTLNTWQKNNWNNIFQQNCLQINDARTGSELLWLPWIDADS